MGDFTVSISAKLVEQLIDDGKKSKKKPKKVKPKIPREPLKPQSKVKGEQISDASEVHKGTASTGWPLQPPVFLPVTPPAPPANAELETIRSAIQEGEKVLDKLQTQEETLAKEVTQRAKDLRDKEFKLPYQKPIPCIVEIDACKACYKENVKNPLKCAPLIQTFADCARRVRQQVSSADKS
ncbi:hypothetical protein HS088_TW20G00255 [Tripterygium wilfordii]|uniref:Uncharacterized protein n=1 Tax=Tripterygium wilfordii TaxID=458696 RepID=A0A7J7C6Y2_TRIWF|nr:uncharacterized protein LOC119986419 [Tripterygium wilfordii]KAF5729889.1 hypothetical protein HS088_TW20G00255 [Tripterygium wilfordii]